MNRQDLTLNELMVFNSEMRSSEKSAAIAYLMLLGGHLGVHRFYLKRKKTAIIQLILFLIATPAYILLSIASAAEQKALQIIGIILFALPAAALFIWVIVDLFLISRMVKEYNKEVERDLIEQIIRYRQ
ncbi:NINE protein [Paenibacillus sp. JDR-2]|uniref:NINE protein n=1 Tax=Paenibacillus sp. (strain JDR-2) TaxID=324057 RepID=UPI000166653A|nr:TM2 domain-containing protein [Paenibacillus sp. JDR-2]ACS99793.1 TM2 domain containing protein [Paenibacillus sp. JDR-2]